MLRMLSILVLGVGAASFASAKGGFEQPGRMAATGFVKAETLAGPHYRVEPVVTVNGYLARFDIESDAGDFAALGAEMLQVRVSEIPALVSLTALGRSDAFVHALQKTALAPLDFAKGLATAPEASPVDVMNGVGELFADAGRTIAQAPENVAGMASDATNVKSNSFAAPAPGFTGDALTYNKAKRDWARNLGVDPYSTNPMLQDKLAAVARVAFAGNLPRRLAAGAVVGPMQYAVDLDQAIRDAVWDLSPGQLESRNEAKLARMGMSGRPVRDFLRTPAFTPTLSTALVFALEKLEGAKGRDTVIAVAASAASEVQARYLRNAMGMLALYAHRGDAVAEIRMSGRIPVGVTQSGTLVVPAAVDYVAWTLEVSKFASRKELSGKRRVLMVRGKVSEIAKSQLEKRGWTIEQGAVAD